MSGCFAKPDDQAGLPPRRGFGFFSFAWLVPGMLGDPSLSTFTNALSVFFSGAFCSLRRSLLLRIKRFLLLKIEIGLFFFLAIHYAGPSSQLIPQAINISCRWNLWTAASVPLNFPTSKNPPRSSFHSSGSRALTSPGSQGCFRFLPLRFLFVCPR